MLHVSPIVDNDDTSAPFTTTGTPDRDLAYEAWLDDVERNRQAELDDEYAAMLAAGEADGCDAAAFHDLTPERYASIIAMMPTDTGWTPVIGYDAGAECPFTSELRRGTAAGPDVVRLPRFYTAENALTAAVLHLINMKLAWEHGDDEAKDCMRRQIEYANRQG